MCEGAITPTLPSLPSAVALGSQTVTQSAVALAVASTTYTGGIRVRNSHSVLSFFVGTGVVTAAAGANRVELGPGDELIWPGSDLSLLSVIAPTGSPIANWTGITL